MRVLSLRPQGLGAWSPHMAVLRRYAAVPCAHVRGVGRPQGDRAPGANQPETSTCTNFKAPVKTKRFNLEPSHLHYSKEGILGYQQELQHDTPS